MTLNIIAKLHKLLQLEDMAKTIKEQAEAIATLTEQVEELQKFQKNISREIEKELDQVDFASIINSLDIELETTLKVR